MLAQGADWPSSSGHVGVAGAAIGLAPSRFVVFDGFVSHGELDRVTSLIRPGQVCGSVGPWGGEVRDVGLRHGCERLNRVGGSELQ